jgi:GNAT superfamily N-acetyltransferase
MQISIRPGTVDDVPLILVFIKELAEYERLSHEVVATEESLRRHLFENRHAEVLIAETGDSRPAGFALFFHNFSTFLGRPGIYLEDLYVRPEFRGQGIGKHLLRELARLAVDRDCGRLEWAVLDWNTPSIDFYEFLGARPRKEWITYRLAGEGLTELAGN